MPLPEYGGTLGHKRAAHLLRRATFGGNKQTIDSYAGLTPAQAITNLFRQTLPDPVLPIDPETGSEWFISGTTGANSENNELEEYFMGWFIGQMLSTGIDAASNPTQWLAYSAREKVVMFLHSHFTTIREKVNNSRALYFQNQLFRIYALDALNPLTNFKDLSVKISVDNAMLRLLDGSLNVKGSVNENYARELLELYSIGRGLEANPPATSGEPGDYGVYTEADVQTAARILSGWDFDEDFSLENQYLAPDPAAGIPHGVVKGNPLTNASAHDNDDVENPKTFSDRFVSALFPGNVIAPDPTLLNGANATQASALDEITKLIDLIYEQLETAKNICRKIYRFYVWAPHTTDETTPIESAIINVMANDFRTNGFKIQPIIENLLRSVHFYEAAGGVTDDNFGGMIKSPLDMILGTIRFFNVQLPNMTTQAEEFYEATSDIIRAMSNMGMKFYEPYDVAGYEAYHQFPVYHRFWITPNTLTQRYNYIHYLLDETQPGAFKVNSYQYVLNNFAAVAPDARQLLIELARYLLPMQDNLTFDDATDDAASITAQRMNYFKARFLNGFDEAYWTTTWNQGTAIEDLEGWLDTLLEALMQSPEYQLA
jgi:uncharacterized protein (DUF1800 family)